MTFLLGALACKIVFAQSYKLAVARRQDVDWVSLISFAAGAALIVPLQATRLRELAGPALWLGLAYGLSGGSAQLFFFRALFHGEMSVSWTIVQLSTIIPVAASIVFWHEYPSPLQAVAIVGMVVAILLMGNVEIRLIQEPLAWTGWMALAFVASGLGGVAMKLLQSQPSRPSEGAFLFFAYLMSVLMTAPLVRGQRPTRAALGIGIVRGGAILATNWLVLEALKVLPGYLVFSMYSAGGVTLNVLFAALAWDERPTRWGYAGIGLAVVSSLVFSLGQ